MPLIEWSSALSIGVTLIDEEHQKLIGYLNRLSDAMAEGQEKKIMTETVADLMAYTNYHFNHEEDLFSSTAYPSIDRHKAEHSRLLKRLFDIQGKLRLGQAEDVSLELLIFLKEWLLQHIQETDLGYVPYLKNHK